MPAPPTPPRAVTIAAVGMKTVSLSGLAVYALVSVVMSAHKPQSLATRAQPELTQMLRDHHCTAPEVINTADGKSAVIRTPAGTLAHVTLEVGEQVRAGVREGTLIAICTDPVHTASR